MQKRLILGVVAAVFIFSALLAEASLAAVPDIGESSCVTYAQARAMSPSLASKTDSELGSMGFCAGTGTATTTATKTTAAPEPQEAAATSGSGLAGMALEQLYDAETKSRDETAEEMNRITEQFKDDSEFSDQLWDVYLEDSSKMIAYFEAYISPEMDDIAQRADDCRNACLKTTKGLGLDEWDRCVSICDTRYSEEYLAAIRKDTEFIIQTNRETIAEVNRMAAERKGVSPLKSPDEQDLLEAERNRIKEETRSAISGASQERTDETVGNAISAAEKNNVAAMLSQMSGSAGITKDGRAAGFAKTDEIISIGDTVTTGKNSALKTTLAEGSKVYVGENSKVRFSNPFEEGIELVLGKIKLFVEKQKAQKFVRVRSPNAAISVRATEFVVEYNETSGTTSVYLRNGSVSLTTCSNREILLEPGNTAVIGKDCEPAVSKLDEQAWDSASGGFYTRAAFSRGFAWLTLAVVAVFFMSSSALIRKEKSKRKPLKGAKHLGLFSLLLGVGGLVSSPLPILSCPMSLTGVAIARIQRMRKKSAVSLIALIINTAALAISAMVLLAYFSA